MRTALVAVQATLAVVLMVRMVVGEGARPVLYGGLLGLAAAFGLALVTAAWVIGDARDPAAYVIVVTVLSIAALAATYLPARRASRIDPVHALRVE